MANLEVRRLGELHDQLRKALARHDTTSEWLALLGRLVIDLVDIGEPGGPEDRMAPHFVIDAHAFQIAGEVGIDDVLAGHGAFSAMASTTSPSTTRSRAGSICFNLRPFLTNSVNVAAVSLKTDRLRRGRVNRSHPGSGHCSAADPRLQ